MQHFSGKYMSILFKHRFSSTITILISVVFFISCNSKDKTNNKNEISPEGFVKLTQFNDSCMSQNLWTGAVVLFGTKDEGTILCNSWGHLSVNKEIKMPENAIFDLASLTKTFATATALGIGFAEHILKIFSS
jgi:hypothetical protein